MHIAIITTRFCIDNVVKILNKGNKKNIYMITQNKKNILHQ